MTVEFKPIGFFRCENQRKHEVVRQGSYDAFSTGTIVLEKGMNLEQGLADLDGFKKIWLLYLFDRNADWKPKVSPQNSDGKIGVFATRSPYRPNPIGLSCVQLEGVHKNQIVVSQHDLLDGTPIIDIKPYLPYADSFSESESLKPHCWWKELPKNEFRWHESATKKSDWIENQTDEKIKNAIYSQLSWDPLNEKKKRVSQVSDRWLLRYRAWKVFFEFDGERRQVIITDIQSALSFEESIPPELVGVHKKFLTDFGDEM